MHGERSPAADRTALCCTRLTGSELNCCGSPACCSLSGTQAVVASMQGLRSAQTRLPRRLSCSQCLAGAAGAYCSVSQTIKKLRDAHRRPTTSLVPTEMRR